jgi:hypothetical protein
MVNFGIGNVEAVGVFTGVCSSLLWNDVPFILVPKIY